MLTQTQKWLLQATLSERETALQAWEQWRTQVDIEALDLAAYRMLSVLYLALTKHGVDDPHIARLKGVYRREWYANQLKGKRLAVGLQVLQAAQIEAVVIGDVALAAACYRDWGARTLTSFELLVPQRCLSLAIEALRANGWQSYAENIEDAQSGPLWFQDVVKEESVSLCLHSRLFWARPQTHTDCQPFQCAIAAQVSGTTAKVLSPVDLLLYMALKVNQRSYKERQSQYLMDAAFAVMAIESEAEWVRLLTQAQRYELILPLRYLLLELQQVLDIALPKWVMPNLQGMAISYHELLSHTLSADDQLLLIKARMVKWRSQWRSLVSWPSALINSEAKQ